MDLSTRRLRYFVAVADELHFSNAAAKLFVSQQTLSKQIHELEAELGFQLLHRTTRSVELTPAGEAMLNVSRGTLARLDEGVEQARMLAQGECGTLTLGFFVLAALELTTPILTEYRRRNAGVRVAMHEYPYNDPSAGLSDETSDLAIIRLPISTPDIEWEPLFTEPRVVAVATTHRLADRESVLVEELAGERMTSAANSDRDFRSFWGLEEFLPASGLPPIRTTSHAEELEVVATGEACSITAACAARYAPHASVRFIPIADVPPVSTVLAWRTANRSPLREDFVRVALEVRDRETELLERIERPSDFG